MNAKYNLPIITNYRVIRNEEKIYCRIIIFQVAGILDEDITVSPEMLYCLLRYYQPER